MPLNERFKRLKRRNWSNYGSIVLSFVAVIAMLSHCLIWPVITPILSTLFPKLLLAHNMCWLVSGMTTFISLSLGVLIAEKLYVKNEQDQIDRTCHGKAVQGSCGKNCKQLIYAKRPLLITSLTQKKQPSITKNQDGQALLSRPSRIHKNLTI